MSLYILESQVFRYPWGSQDQIPAWLGKAQDGEPQAELWMGAHPKAPSALLRPDNGVKDPAQPQDLLQLIQSDPRHHLGERVAGQFGRLPFLFKLLSAAEPLSLQAHPTKQQARAGFARENAAGIPLAASHRNYKDDSDKPELIYALSEFVALSGFRDPSTSSHELSQLVHHCPTLRPAFEALLRAPTEQGLRQTFVDLFNHTKQMDQWIGAIAAQLASSDCPESLLQFAPWFLRLSEKYPGDPGVLASLLLNFVTLSPGQAMFLPAGNLHAYLAGLGLEVMANSDNVLRGGLTAKHIDISELCDVLRFSAFAPELLEGTVSLGDEANGRRTYPTPSPEFLLSITSPAATGSKLSGPSIGFILEGTVRLETSNGHRRSVAKGGQFFVSHASPLRAYGEASVALCSVPQFDL